MSDDDETWQYITKNIDKIESNFYNKHKKDKYVPKKPHKNSNKEQKKIKISNNYIKKLKNKPKIEQNYSIFTASGIDKNTYDRLKKGKLEIQATLDLHGMTQDQARRALITFIETQHAKGSRLALVITGKGDQKRGHTPRDTGISFETPKTGILRNAVPEWLSSPPLVDKILKVTKAQQKHGGTGALYVYLKK